MDGRTLHLIPLTKTERPKATCVDWVRPWLTWRDVCCEIDAQTDAQQQARQARIDALIAENAAWASIEANLAIRKAIADTAAQNWSPGKKMLATMPVPP